MFKNDNMKGFSFMLFGMFLFSVVDWIGKAQIMAGFPLFWILFGAYCGYIIIMIFYKPSSFRDLLESNSRYLVILRAILMCSATVFFAFSLKDLPIGIVAGTIAFSPIFSSFLGFMLLNEKVGFKFWILLFLGFIGILSILGGIGAEALNIAFVLPLISMCFYSVNLVLLRKLGGVDSSIHLSTLGIVGAIICLVAGGLTQEVSFPAWYVVVSMGGLGFVGHYFVVRAYSLAPIHLVSPADYTSFIWGIIGGIFIFGESFAAIQWFGFLIITIVNLFVAKFART